MRVHSYFFAATAMIVLVCSILSAERVGCAEPIVAPLEFGEWWAPDDADSAGNSMVGISVLTGQGLSLYSAEDSLLPGSRLERRLQLSPDKPAIVGRQEGGRVPYLDPKYVSTQMMPYSNRPVVSGNPKDLLVSRAHFMLRANARGILLVNAVPRKGGGMRAPRNGTRLFSAKRDLAPAEEYLIERGKNIKILLPNNTLLLINAEYE